MQSSKAQLTVCVTGAAGQIGYAFIPLLLTGLVFGPETEINLRLLDVQQAEKALVGVEMEIQDGAYPLLASIQSGSDPKILFKDIDVGIFIGGFPRKAGMERKELLELNGKIFIEQGEALNTVAKKDVKVVVVANPANTNCLILQHSAPSIDKRNFSCLTRLDHNRALSQLAGKNKVKITDVKNVAIWGNHSSTQYPDVNHGTLGGKPIRGQFDDEYLNTEFIGKVQKRGAEILAARGLSSVFSAANAVKDHLRDWFHGIQDKDVWTSMGIITDGSSYGIPSDLCFSFPVKLTGKFHYEIVQGLKIDEFSQQKLDITTKELQEEKAEALNK